MSNVNFALGWVRESVIAKLKGYTSDMIQKDVKQGHLIEGVHFKYDVRKRKWWNYEALDAHIENGMKPTNENG